MRDQQTCTRATCAADGRTVYDCVSNPKLAARCILLCAWRRAPGFGLHKTPRVLITLCARGRALRGMSRAHFIDTAHRRTIIIIIVIIIFAAVQNAAIRAGAFTPVYAAAATHTNTQTNLCKRHARHWNRDSSRRVLITLRSFAVRAPHTHISRTHAAIAERANATHARKWRVCTAFRTPF